MWVQSASTDLADQDSLIRISGFARRHYSRQFHENPESYKMQLLILGGAQNPLARAPEYYKG